ncbi:MAG TPA: tagatose-6-phosphate ketose isomerase [Acidobacteriota bacterium]
MPILSLAEPEWLRSISKTQSKAEELLARTPDEQNRLGYFHTLREICQQPTTWTQTCSLMLSCAPTLKKSLDGLASLILTGSGSSEYAGDCVRQVLQNELRVTTQAIGGGILLTDGSKALPVGRPAMMVSLARSGDSPESVGALSVVLALEPEIRHLVLTCNEAGSLAKTYQDHSRVHVITTAEGTNDQSLVMTSSFTNLVLAARFLGLTEQPEAYRTICERLSKIASDLLNTQFDNLARLASVRFLRAVFLGTGSRFGAAREAALKMLEMTAGRVTTLCETYLGLRHGPMSYVDKDTLVVCFLSSDPTIRAYETDLLHELDQKELGLLKLIIGEDVPKGVLRPNDVVIECRGLREVGDQNAPVIDVVVGQLLGFFRCLNEGLRPDSPSEDGIINRVVQSFTLH